MLDEKQKQLLCILADGQCHSGESLGRALGISRAAVWKQLARLEAVPGLALQRLQGQGYQLPYPMSLLDGQRIRSAMSAHSQALLGGLELLDSVDSTNACLLARAMDPAAPSGLVCLAECQTAGRGRRGRAWVSPYAANVYLSVLWRYTSGAAALEGLSLAVGLVVLESLQALDIPGLQLKWPNDVVTASGKLAGVLVDMAGDPMGECQVVVGIGINVAMPVDCAAGISQPWVDLRQLAGVIPDRNRITGMVLDRLLPLLAGYPAQGFAPYRNRWMAFDACRGRTVTLALGDQSVVGQGDGVDEKGAFRLLTDHGIRLFSGGEVSLRATP